MKKLIQYGLVALVIGGYFLYNKSDDSSDSNYTANDIDLNAVLDVTIDTIYSFEESLEAQDQDTLNSDDTFIAFSEQLQTNYNTSEPALHWANIAVAPRNDASLLAFEDSNGDNLQDENEPSLFLVEIDGENSRIIASSRSGAVNDHHFSGTGLLAGFLIGSMLNRQRAAGVNTSSLANKKPVTARAAAKSRAGSGSHSTGK